METIGIIIVVLGVFHTIRIYLAGRAARRQHPPMQYAEDSTPNTDPWRWRHPNEAVGLQLEDEEQESRISFPVELNSIDYVVSVFGSLAYIGGILLLLYGTYTYFFTGAEGEETAFWLISIACVMAFFGAVCFSVRQRIVSLIRTPANLIVRYTYGAFWVRSIRFTKDTPISVRAKDQSITDYDTTQDVPYSEVTIKKISWMVSFRPVKFYVLANPSQVSWIKGGLMDWFASEENLSQNESST